MDFKQLHYVLKVAELQNITKAANELYVSQPSLSHYLSKIEEELGTQIFNRMTTPLTLTPAGERYVDTAKKILSLNDNMKDDILAITSNKKGVITMGMSHARASYFLPFVLPDFKAKYPGVDVKTVESRSDIAESNILKGNCDLGILPLPVTSMELETEEICEEELLLVSGRPLEQAVKTARGEKINLGDLAEEKFVILKKGHGIRNAIDVLFMEHGIKTTPLLETTSNETAYRLATTGMAVSIVPKSTIELSNYIKKPYIYSLSEQGVFWKIAAVYRKGEELNEAQRTMVEMLKKIES